MWRHSKWSMRSQELMRHLCQCSNTTPGLILYLRPANERRRYIVTAFLIGWVQIYDKLWYAVCSGVHDIRRPFAYMDLSTLIPSWIGTYMHSNI